MRAFCIIIVILIGQSAHTQELIGQRRANVKKSLEKITGTRDTVSRQLTETDSSLVLITRNNNSSSTLQIIYSFNKNGVCFQEKVKANSAEYLAPFLENVLAKKIFDWKKINEHQYITGFEQKMFLELPPDGEQSSFMIFRVDWNKEMYNVLRGSSAN